MQYGNNYVDERYSKILEPNLYAEAILQPGKTFNPAHQGEASAGLVKVYKITRDGASDPQTPAGDFNHENTANTLIDVRLNNAFRKSKKIYKVTANSVSYALAEETLQTAVKDNQEDWQRSGMACLVHEGTVSANTAALTSSNIKKEIVAVRKELRKKHARPDVCICDVDTYALVLEAAGKDYTPISNENVLTTGRVGSWLGMTFYEGDILDGTAKYYDHTGELQSVDLTTAKFIMYDHHAFSCIDNLEVMRIVDATDFTGCYAQNEINTGFRVTNTDMVFVRTTTA